jgi:hypothetical protein
MSCLASPRMDLEFDLRPDYFQRIKLLTECSEKSESNNVSFYHEVAKKFGNNDFRRH